MSCEYLGCPQETVNGLGWCRSHYPGDPMDLNVPAPVPNKPSDHLKLCPGCRKVRIYKEVDVCAACSNKGRKAEPSAIGDELGSLYRPEITDLEKNEYQGNDRPVIYLADAKRVLEEQTKLARREGELFGRSDELVKLSEWGKRIDDQWNEHFASRLAELKSEASIKERSEG